MYEVACRSDPRRTRQRSRNQEWESIGHDRCFLHETAAPEARREVSPARQGWEKVRKRNQSAGGATVLEGWEKASETKPQETRHFHSGIRVPQTACHPYGVPKPRMGPRIFPTLTGWANFRRASGADLWQCAPSFVAKCMKCHWNASAPSTPAQPQPGMGINGQRQMFPSPKRSAGGAPRS